MPFTRSIDLVLAGHHAWNGVKRREREESHAPDKHDAVVLALQVRRDTRLLVARAVDGLESFHLVGANVFLHRTLGGRREAPPVSARVFRADHHTRTYGRAHSP